MVPPCPRGSKHLFKLLPHIDVIPKAYGQTYAIQKNPSRGSYGDFLLLRYFLRVRQRHSWLKAHKPEEVLYLKIRKRFLKKLAKTGKLHCAYCGKGPLKIDGNNFFDKRKMATVDHIHPVSKGGPKLLMSNFVCSCEKCNRDKADNYLEEPVT